MDIPVLFITDTNLRNNARNTKYPYFFFNLFIRIMIICDSKKFSKKINKKKRKKGGDAFKHLLVLVLAIQDCR